MPRWPAVLALGAGVVVAGQSGAETPDAAEARLMDKAVACINARATEVDRLESDMLVGAEFLIRYVCAKEVAAFTTYNSSFHWLQNMRSSSADLAAAVDDEEDGKSLSPEQKKTFEEQQAKAHSAWESTTIDPDTGELVFPKDKPAGWIAFPALMNDATVPPALRAVTGEALMRARAIRLNLPYPKKA